MWLPPFLFPSPCFHWILLRFAAASSAVVCTAASVVYRSIATTTTTTPESTGVAPALLPPSQSAVVTPSMPPPLLLLLRAHLILQGFLSCKVVATKHLIHTISHPPSPERERQLVASSVRCVSLSNGRCRRRCAHCANCGICWLIGCAGVLSPNVRC